MTRPAFLFGALLLLGLSGTIESADADPEIGRDATLTASEDAARAASEELLARMREALARELSTGGPVSAVKACSELAPAIAGELSRKNGWRVTRVGTRIRNPLLGTPDAWEQTVLAGFSERLAKGEKLESLSYSEQVTGPAGRSFRYMRAIGVQPQCLMCHGSPDQLPEAVQTMLKEQYPHDRATGYRAGELRGAVSIQQPLPAVPTR